MPVYLLFHVALVIGKAFSKTTGSLNMFRAALRASAEPTNADTTAQQAIATSDVPMVDDQDRRLWRWFSFSSKAFDLP